MSEIKFSQRKGFVPVSEVVQYGEMSDELRNSLWNILKVLTFDIEGFTFAQYSERPKIHAFSRWMWHKYFKEPIDTIPPFGLEILKQLRKYFFSCEWYQVYDFIEFTLKYLDDPVLQNAINTVLEQELSGYRFVNGLFTEITDDQEIDMLEGALADPDFPGVKAHLRRSLELLSDREQPDYRNSIKEAISAVESIAQVITNDPKASLGDALKKLERSGNIHPALKEGFSKLYGYTSDEQGIRHAMLDEPNLTAADAKYFLISCTSFINYLKSKM